jgi:NADH-quinone oxidoreductase subunit H
MTALIDYLAAHLAWFENLLAVYPLLTYIVFFAIAGSAIMMAFITPYALLIIWAERRVAGRIQCRYGPNRVGPFGLLQSIADGIKLLTKEDIVPDQAIRFLFTFAPTVVFVGTFVPFVTLPFGPNVYTTSMNLGVFFVASFMALEVIGVIMAGWASNSKWALYGGMRLAAQMMSYEIPLGLSIATVAVFCGSLNFVEIVEAQGPIWNIFRSPFLFVAFIIYYIAALASAKRAPFDLPEAESELVSGFHTEYSGMRFSFFFLAEYTAMYVLSAVGVLLFLGGWYGPIPVFWLDLLTGQFMEPGLAIVLPDAWAAAFTGWMMPGAWLNVLIKELIFVHNLLIKAGVLLFLMLQLRWTLPRLRIDQVMHLCWKVLLPFILVCFLGAAFQALVFL